MVRRASAPLTPFAPAVRFSLDGDFYPRPYLIDFTQGDPSPRIVFPSGVACALWDSRVPHGETVQICGALALPLHATRDAAYARAACIADRAGYTVQKIGESHLAVWGLDPAAHVLITYDPAAGVMMNVAVVGRG